MGVNMYTKPALHGRKNFELPADEVYSSGHLACPGCGVSISARVALKYLGRKTILVVPACCFAVIDGPFPYSAAGVPLLHCAFESAGATASGVRAALGARGIDDVNVVAWAGDGGTYDIGLQSLSAAAERNEDIIYVCYDNEAYMNTGIQRSSSTPMGAWTTTTPAYPGKHERKKDIAQIMIAHRIPYFATATVSYLDDFGEKFRKASKIRGFRFILLYSPCTAGWKYPESETIELGFLAVKSRMFPLFEVENGGENWKITMNPAQVPVEEYLKRQGRFRHLKEHDIREIQTAVDKYWGELIKKCGIQGKQDPPSERTRKKRGSLPDCERFEAMLKSTYLVDLSPGDLEMAYLILKSRWNDPSTDSLTDDELISQTIALVQMHGSF